ncbi:hypothetical protein MOU_05714 [Xanthomonas citri pv. malvacearum str. GSPB1386]|nr:hypothetical protein BGK55_01925 [Xanthomonas citri pv. malvacearum]EKQ65549.1 hypothetical protein MOU_05714 [Xanthomonas citri pv. malvacearum str. GSPB1386]
MREQRCIPPARCGVNSARGAAAQAPTAANRQGVSGGKQCAVQLTHTYQEQRSWQASAHAHTRTRALACMHRKHA